MPQWVPPPTSSQAGAGVGANLPGGVLQALLNLPNLANEDDTYQVCPVPCEEHIDERCADCSSCCRESGRSW